MRPPRSLTVGPWLVACVALVGCPSADDDDTGGADTVAAGDTTEGTDSGGTGPAAATGDGTGGGACFEAPQCDPLSPDCSGTDKCVPDDGVFVCMAVRDGAEELGVGEACTGALSCAEGLACLPIALPGCVGGAGCCVAICELSAPQCPQGTGCTALFSSGAPLCYEEIGVCTVS